MRKLKKRLASLGVGLAVMAASVASLGASASTFQFPWEGTPLEWGPHYTRPYTGQFSASSELVSVSGVKWDSSQLSTIVAQQEQSDIIQNGTYTEEFEFRPVDANLKKVNPSKVWVEKSRTSNLPAAYFEWDSDDVTVGCYVPYASAGKSYYGNRTMEPKSTPLITNLIFFEVEYGFQPMGMFDSGPIYYMVYNIDNSGTFINGQPYSW